MRNRTYILILCFVGLIAYAMVLRNGFVGDDDIQIVRNLPVHSISNFFNFFTTSTYENAGNDSIVGIFYRPFMMMSFSSMYFLFGPNPAMFHLVQLILQIANAVLLYHFLKRFLKEPTAFVCSLLFLIHPINVEAVVYSANLQEVLFFAHWKLPAYLVHQRRT